MVRIFDGFSCKTLRNLGYKEQGITFPSGERQAQLLEEVYAEAGIDPNQVYYVETHGTGTKVREKNTIFRKRERGE